MKNFQSNPDSVVKEMLDSIGEKSLDGLYSMIDKRALTENLNLPNALSEMETQKEISKTAKHNKTEYSYFIGGGAYKRFIPAAISQISSRFEFNTAYTPYQPEISQGTLQVIYEFQSIMCDLTGMDVCNASVYDAGNACAEAMLMAVRISGKNKILVSSCLNPEYIGVIKTYAHAAEVEIEFAGETEYKTDLNSVKDKIKSGDYAGLIIQNPNYYGTLEDTDTLKTLEKSPKSVLITCIEPISASILKKPSEYNTDITVGDVQSMGNPVSFGGPYAGFIATKDVYKRQMPGRIVGRTLDAESKQAFTLTLQAREQHIRREKATSNICSNQGLAILNAAIYASLLGKKGLNQAAYMSSKNAHTLANGLKQNGFKILNKDFFNEFVLEVNSSDNFIKKMKENNILAGIKISDNKILVCATEVNTKEETDKYIQIAKNN